MCCVGITRTRRMRKKAVQQGRSKRSGESFIRTRPPRACQDRLLSRGRTVSGELLRFTTREITRVTFVNAAEPVSRPCLARTPLADFFRILLGLQRRQHFIDMAGHLHLPEKGLDPTRGIDHKRAPLDAQILPSVHALLFIDSVGLTDLGLFVAQ